MACAAAPELALSAAQPPATLSPEVWRNGGRVEQGAPTASAAPALKTKRQEPTARAFLPCCHWDPGDCLCPGAPKHVPAPCPSTPEHVSHCHHTCAPWELAHGPGSPNLSQVSALGHHRDMGTGTWGHGMKPLCYETSLHPMALSQDLVSERLLIQMRSGITKGFVFQEAY